VEPPPPLDPVVRPFKETAGELLRLAKGVARLNLAGLSHGDLTPSNVGFDPSGGPVMLDFDQCVAAHPLRCLARDFVGLPCADQPAQYTLWDRAGRVSGWGWLRWPGRVRDRLRRRRRLFAPPGLSLERQAEMRDDSELAAMARCWAAAAASDASSPGAGKAYYSLDVRGFHLPGERPWPLRWEMLWSAVSFRGKRVVELGCNLGLLSIFARLAGAESAAAADHNHAVISAGAELARLCGADVDFSRVDFDRDVDWENGLGDGDLATALSLSYWLRDKDRLWRYLARFPEVLFEGHEPTEEIELRLRSMGFARIVAIGRSERNRVVFYARKS
ncbi:MAG: Lipopolysaccharide kinase (Kdo/WaaP) family, partial [Verrucomicrobiota bacterium]